MQELTIGYEELMNVLGYCGACLKDRVVQDKDKKLMFRWEGGTLGVVAYTPTLSTRLEFETASGNTEEPWSFNLKAFALIEILSVYTTLSRTFVEKVTLKQGDKDRVLLTISEGALDEEDTTLARESHYTLQGQNVPDVILKEVAKGVPEEGWVAVEGNLLSLYLETLQGVLRDDSTGSVARNIFIGKEQVFSLGEATKHVFKNGLPEELSDITLPYNTVSYLIKMLGGTPEGFEVAREKGYLHIRSGGVVASIREKNVRTSVEKDIIEFSEVPCLELDKLYLKDVLRRATVVGKEATIELNDGYFEITAGDFEQEIPAVVAPELVGVRFMVSIPILEKCLLGGRDFSESLELYFVQQGNIWKLYITDESHVWFSLMSVRGVR